MTHKFYESFASVPYPCYWLGGDGIFWSNTAANDARGLWADTDAMHRLLDAFARGMRTGEAAGAQSLPVLTDALRLQGLTVIPHPDGIFATASEDGASPVSAFSGQLREPLANIFAVLPLLAKRLDGSDLRYAEEIQQSCYYLLRLTENLETAGRVEKQTFEMHTLDMAALVESLCVCAESVCKERGIHIEKEITGPLPVKADAKVLSSVFLNILRNSLQYTRDGNVIRIRLAKKGDRAVLTMEDKGLGIRAENLPHVFEPYFSMDPYGDSAERPGLGLGLSIVRESVQRFRGSVAAESRFGEGTGIHISLPLAQEEEELLGSDAADYLLNRYSPVYVQLSGLCRLPGF